MPNAETTLPALLARKAAEQPDAPYVVSAETGVVWTYADADSDADRWAAALAGAGVREGQTVLIMLPPCTEAVAAWIGLARLRAMEVPINTGYLGQMLRYVIEDSEAGLMVAHAEHLPEIEKATAGTARTRTLQTIVVVGAEGALPHTAFHLVRAEDFLATAAGSTAVDPPTGRDIASIIYTSGTTGASKGVLVTWRQAELTATGIMPTDLFGSTDAFYSPFSMFHMSGKSPLYATALLGARVIMRRRFDTARFWDDIRTHGATTTILLGAMANFLWQQPEHPDDAGSPLRDALLLPLVGDVGGFARRFGLRVRTTFNMTETACCILSDVGDLANDTSCGRLRSGFQARVVDADDNELGPGELGELVLRADEPWTLMAGYWRKPEATAQAWRNLWFHTGDGFTRDADGNFYFVDRIKDAIRRRGENISSAEVEHEVNAHPDVLESAAVAVPSEHGEDEIKIVVVARPGATPTPEEIVGFLCSRVARFMVPRYVEIVESLPKTPTQKVRKVELRAAGISPATWDREAGQPRRRTPATS
ncbi:AMP-binding protein [Pseudonocardia nematodicida]|uniref:AMP-binding protein n=1 Tax=Pseudonocardia nematodicida TaxID=1206997 RepID=A0ABV1KDW8_9PSEU